MGARIRDFDWSTTSLGALGQWPQSLRTAVGLMVASRHPMWIGWGPDATFLYNDASVSGLSRAKHPWALGRPAAEVWAEIWDVCGPLADKVFRHGEATVVDEVPLFLNRGGFIEETYYSFSYSPIRDESGRVAGLFCASADVSTSVLNARRLADARESEVRFRNVADHAPVMIWVTEPDGRCSYLSKPWYDFTGQTPETGLGFGWLDVTHPQDRADAEKMFHEANLTRSSFRLEYRLRRRDGVYRWAIDSAAPRFSPEGEFLGYVGSVIDITERQEAENEKLRSQALLAAVLKQLPFGLGVADKNGSWLLTNAPMDEYVTGTLPSIGLESRKRWKAWNEHGTPIPPENWPGQRALRGEIVSPGLEMVFTDAAGRERWIRVGAAPLRDVDGQIIGATALMQDIEAEKRAEEALRESEKRFRAFVTTSANVVYRMNADWSELRLLVGNDFIADAPDPTRTWLEKYIYPDEQPRLLAAIQEAVRSKSTFQLEHRVIRVDGTLGWASSRAIPLLDAKGEIVEWFGAASDVTERKRAEAALRESEERFRAAVSAVSSLIWTNNARGEMEGEQPGWGGFTGQKRAEYQGYGWAQAVHPEDAQASIDAWNYAVAEKRMFEFEHRVRRNDGEWRLCSIRAVPVFDESGGIREWVGVHNDITEQRRAEEKVRESAERIRFMAESMPQKIFTARPSGEVNYFNRQWMEFTGLTYEQIRDWGWLQFIHPDDVEENVRRWNQSVQTGEYFELEHRFRRHDGVYRWHLSRAHAMRDARDEVLMWIGSNTDIDDQKRAEEKLEKTVAERTTKLREIIAELEAFSYSIAHDLRAPLRSLQGFSDALLSDYAEKLDVEGQSYLRRISRSAGRMDKLIQDVLSYSRVVRSDWPLAPVDVEQLLRGIADTYPMLAPERAHIALEGEFPPVLGSEAMLMQIFSNLLGNAVKFVAPGTKPQIRVWAEPRGERVRVFVRDNGIGIAPEQHEKIFGIFHQVRKSHEGTGIGLAIVKKAVERMGGKLGVESQLGHGTTFWIDMQRA